MGKHNKLILVLLWNFVFFSPAEASSGFGGLGALDGIRTIFAVIATSCVILFYSILFVIYRIARKRRYFLLFLFTFDFIVIAFTSLLLFLNTDDGYHCSFGGFLWDSILKGYWFFFSFQFFLLLIILMTSLVLLTLRSFDSPKGHGALMHLITCLAISVTISMIFEYAPIAKLFLNRKAYIAHLINTPVYSHQDCQWELRRSFSKR